MRSFWPQFDSFYFGSDPVLSLQAVGGVISFPSFHSVVGFLVLTMWRKRPATLLPAAVWLLFMLVATLPGGGHYIVDLLGGFTVWAIWFTLSLKIEAQARRGAQVAGVLGQRQ
jgi:membrane-associated phospholipid phosphatase